MDCGRNGQPTGCSRAGLGSGVAEREVLGRGRLPAKDRHDVIGMRAEVDAAVVSRLGGSAERNEPQDTHGSSDNQCLDPQCVPPLVQMVVTTSTRER